MSRTRFGGFATRLSGQVLQGKSAEAAAAPCAADAAVSPAGNSQAESQTKASTSRGPGLLNMAFPSTQQARPSRTARRSCSHAQRSEWASSIVCSIVSPHGQSTSTSGSAASTFSLATRKDFFPGPFRTWQPPANSTSSGVQCPPTKTGSAHSRKATEGLRTLERASAAEDISATRPRSADTAAAASLARPSATPRRNMSSKISSSVCGLKLSTEGSLSRPAMATLKSFGLTEQTSHRLCVRTTSGRSRRNSSSKTA
mmetsp:Transcript_62673/g.141299  ORF Transcript_62673/g.141299 Transcript_62673/m.141299 type:complete len:257 (+) Transcript_62673:155-925(+)